MNLAALDLGYLALFVGQRVNELVLERLHEAGYGGVRTSHGYVVQHLVDEGPASGWPARSVTELAALLGVTQQAASKVVSELARLCYLEDAPADDRRVRRVRLSRRGRAMVAKARELRADVEASGLGGLPPASVGKARAVLVSMLERLGGADAVKGRRVRES